MTQVQTKLFTDLTQEQSQIVEGGLSLSIYGLRALNANADGDGTDETYIRVKGSQIWGPQNFTTGDGYRIDQKIDIGDYGRVELFDQEVGLDNPMGAFTVFAPTAGLTSQVVNGSGSAYRVYYEVG